MKNSSHTSLWIIAMVIVAGLAYWFGTSRPDTNREPVLSDSNRQTETVAPVTPTAVSEIPAPTETIKPRVAGNLIYVNPKYGFTLELPARWKDYRVAERINEPDGDHYAFELKLIDGKYSSPFAISVHTREVWENLQAEPGPKPSYLGEKNAYVFGYSYGHDDANYAGFGQPEPGLRFKGPIFDAQEIIVPSFEIK